MSAARPPDPPTEPKRDRPQARAPQPDGLADDDGAEQLADDEKEAVDAAQVFALRQTYWRNGYRPVSVVTRQKYPKTAAWRADALQDPPLWATHWPDVEELSTGIVTGHCVGVDVDVLIQAAVDRIVYDVEQLLGTTPLVRIGLAPKTLMAYRCEEPFRKLSTGVFIMPDGSEAKVEILADGQQFVADGIHPDTGEPYYWPARAPQEMPLDQASPITLGQGQAIIAAATAILIANGGVVKAPPKRDPRANGAASGEGFFAQVNAAALRSIAAWVKHLFPQAKYQPLTGAWRVSSRDRGRPDLQEDISVHPDGIQDFGLERPLSPIDVVIEFGGADAAPAAAHWLCERLGIAPTTLGWHDGATPDNAQPSRPEREQDKPEPEPPPHPSPTPDTDEWPEPVDILADSDAGAPILTADHVPPALWPYIKDTAARMGVATSSVALSTLVACSSAISEDWKLQPKQNDPTWTEQSRLWGAIVGIASILKSPVIRTVTAPIVTLNMVAHEAWAKAAAGHKAALAAWKVATKAGGTDPEPKPPRKARYLVESVTVEALQEVLRDDPDGGLYAPLGKVLARHDELAEFVANLDKYSGGGDRGAWLRAYDGGPYVVDRIKRGSFVTKSWSCCLIGGIQPEVIQRIARNSDDDGLLQRFMFDVPAQQERGEDRSPDYAALNAYRDMFPALAALGPARTGDAHDRYVVVILHRDAHAMREDINVLARVMAAMPDASPRLQSAFGKWPGLFARLCLTFHLIEAAASRVRDPGGLHPPLEVISADTARAVQNYMRGVLAPNLLRADSVMFSTRMTTHADWIAGYILAGKLSRITARDIAKDYGALRPPEQRRTLDETMDSLHRIGWVEPVPPANPAKPPTAWQVNPRVHVAYALRAEAERKRRDAVRQEIAEYVASLRKDAANAS